MTLAEMLYTLKHDNGGDYELFINRDVELATYGFSCISNTVDEWIEAFKQGYVYYMADDDFENEKEPYSAEYYEFGTALLFEPCQLMDVEGDYKEPAYHWVMVG